MEYVLLSFNHQHCTCFTNLFESVKSFSGWYLVIEQTMDFYILINKEENITGRIILTTQT